jgi:hypothetical protein
MPKNLMCTSAKKCLLVLACFQASAKPRLENPNSDEKDALFGFDTQITILSVNSLNTTIFNIPWLLGTSLLNSIINNRFPEKKLPLLIWRSSLFVFYF